jgi:hypothetical protein
MGAGEIDRETGDTAFHERKASRLHAPSADGNPVADNLCATTGGAIGGEGNGANVLVAPVAVAVRSSYS